MSDNSLSNQRRFFLKDRIKKFLLKRKYKDKVILNGDIRILGKMPSFKLPGESKIILGDKVVLNSDFFKSNTALTYRCTFACGLKGILEIGDNSMLNGVCITAYEKVVIGRNCHIASSTLITDTDYHPVDPIIREREVMGYEFNYDEVQKKPVNIGNNVWIGWGSTILKGVTIGDNSIVAAGSVVVTDIPPNVIVAGNPAKVKRKI